MAYRMKDGGESFTVVDGPFERRTFVPGRIYEEIPLQETHRFTEIKEAAAPDAPVNEVVKPAKADIKKAASGPPESGG